jgi:hypothetical protein
MVVIISKILSRLILGKSGDCLKMKTQIKSGWVDVKPGVNWPEDRHIRHVRRQLDASQNQWALIGVYKPSAPYELEPSGEYPCFKLTFERRMKNH